MREIFYIPEGKSIDDYTSEWKDNYSIVQVGLSPNIEEYVDNPDIAQLILIPEYKTTICPVTTSSNTYFQVEYFDDFETIKDVKPEVWCHVWSKDLDNPSIEQKRALDVPMHYEVGRKCFITDHIKLDTGWYDVQIIIKRSSSFAEVMDEKEITVWEDKSEEE